MSLLRFDLGPDLRDPDLPSDLDVLGACLETTDGGTAVEFGVGAGESTALIAAYMPVIGFDSFEGLPEDWRPDFRKGAFAQQNVPEIPGATIVVGLFEDTAMDYVFPTDVSLIHFDADLYSSTKTALAATRHLIKPGVILVFDEFFGFTDDYSSPGETGERRAFREFLKETNLSYDVIGHGREQWAIRVLERNEA